MDKRITTNGKIIRDLMLAHKVKGNYKDFVVITGSRLMDWAASFDIRNVETGQAASTPRIMLIHKRDLNRVIGPEAAKAFWRKGIGRTGSSASIMKSILDSKARLLEQQSPPQEQSTVTPGQNDGPIDTAL